MSVPDSVLLNAALALRTQHGEDVPENATVSALLITAINVGNNCVVAQLLEQKASPSLTDTDGEPAIAVASRKGRLCAVSMLIDAKADPNARFVIRAREYTPLAAACSRRSLPIVAQLLRHGADPNYVVANASTPCSIAAGSGEPHILRTLIANKADVNFIPSGGVPLLFGITCNECADVLINAKADVDAIHHDASALHVAVSLDFLGVARKLIRAGANVNRRDADGRTPLLVAAAKKSILAVRALIEAKADPNISDSSNRFPIGYAVASSNVDVAELLIEANAVPRGVDVIGALSIAAASPSQTSLRVAELVTSAASD